MSDPRLSDLLAHRAERGERRGAKQVWADANAIPYVIEPPPVRPNPAFLAAAASSALVLTAASLLAWAVVRSSGPDVAAGGSTIVFPGGGSPDLPAHCLLEVDDSSQPSLRAWADRVRSTPGLRDEAVRTEGQIVLFTWGRPPVVMPPGSQGIFFEARPARAAEPLLDEPGAVRVTCAAWPGPTTLPDELPAGTEVVIAFLDPDGGTSLDDAWPDLFRLPGVMAVELVDRQRAHAEYQELFAGASDPRIPQSLEPHELPESVRLLVTSDSTDDVQAAARRLPGVIQVARTVPSLEGVSVEPNDTVEPRVTSQLTPDCVVALVYLASVLDLTHIGMLPSWDQATICEQATTGLVR
jgi:hypothetical protein